MQKLIQAVPGVADCKVDFKSKTAKVTVKEDMDPKVLTSAVKGQYGAKVKGD